MVCTQFHLERKHQFSFRDTLNANVKLWELAQDSKWNVILNSFIPARVFHMLLYLLKGKNKYVNWPPHHPPPPKKKNFSWTKKINVE